MRLDKFLSVTKKATRSEGTKFIKAGKVSVNGIVAKKGDMQINENTDEVVFFGEKVNYKKFVYVMLNKPDGYVSATDDASERTVLDLLPEEIRKFGLFPCGRLDKNTLGLMILTNDGEGAHRALSPKHHVPKVYRFECEKPLTDGDIAKLEGGVDIGGYVTKPCAINGDKIEITEGKYHQIKRMFEAIGNRVTGLERISFGGVTIDESLERGQWRYLTDEEEKTIFENYETR